jgi:hypothetical protein
MCCKSNISNKFGLNLETVFSYILLLHYKIDYIRKKIYSCRLQTIPQVNANARVFVIIVGYEVSKLWPIFKNFFGPQFTL